MDINNLDNLPPEEFLEQLKGALRSLTNAAVKVAFTDSQQEAVIVNLAEQIMVGDEACLRAVNKVAGEVAFAKHLAKGLCEAIGGESVATELAAMVAAGKESGTVSDANTLRTEVLRPALRSYLRTFVMECIEEVQQAGKENPK